MSLRRAIFSALCLTVFSHLAGCASIISGRSATVAIDSYPTSAHVTVRDDKGRTVASTTTPGVVSLKRNRKYFLPARYTATIEAPGYAPAQVPIRSTVNPWVFGNIAIGGIAGLVVDNATGAAWKPKQSEIHQHLAPLCAPDQGPMFSSDDSPSARSATRSGVSAHEGDSSGSLPLVGRAGEGDLEQATFTK